MLERAPDDLHDGAHPRRAVTLGQLTLEGGEVVRLQGRYGAVLAQALGPQGEDVVALVADADPSIRRRQGTGRFVLQLHASQAQASHPGDQP